MGRGLERRMFGGGWRVWIYNQSGCKDYAEVYICRQLPFFAAS